MRRGVGGAVRHLIARDVVAARRSLNEKLLLDITLFLEIKRGRVERVAMCRVANRTRQGDRPDHTGRSRSGRRLSGLLRAHNRRGRDARDGNGGTELVKTH